MEIFAHHSLYAKFINGNKGYGVFTRFLIPKNTLIETCYCVPSNEEEWKDFSFGAPPSVFLPLGFGVIYNHSYDSNIEWRETNYPYIIQFFTTKEIAQEEELCHNYGKGYWKQRVEKKIL